MGFFDKLKAGLKKTKDALLKPVNDLFSSYDKVDEDFYDELCDLLIMADVGVETSDYLVNRLRETLKEKKIKETTLAREEFKAILADAVGDGGELNLGGDMSVILVIGVNGVGKTTSIGKLANYYKSQGKKVLLAAGDTFRAAAASQLNQWADRSGVDIVMHDEGADPASVIFEAVEKGKNQGYDIVICDTAGRLHNKKNLMAELGKISRVIRKASDTASVETLLVLEAITGQNAIFQAKEFISAAEATGIILTKLDGTAKGGSVISIKKKLGIPVRFVGVGEGVDDLLLFDPQSFAETLFSLGDGE